MQKQRKIDRRKPSREFYRVLTLGVSLLTLFTVGFLYYQARFVGRIAQLPAFEFPVKLPFFAPPAEGSSFTDLFSGTGWLNATGTALYQDFAMTTLSFPPKFEWEKVPEQEIGEDLMMSLRGAPSFSVIARPPQAAAAISPPAFIRLQEDGSDRRCLGNQCLIQKGTELLLDGQRISLPIELQTPNLLNISIGAIYPVRNDIFNGADNFWFLGGVVKRDVIASPQSGRGNPSVIARSERSERRGNPSVIARSERSERRGNPSVIASPAPAGRGNPDEIASSEDLLAMTNSTPPRDDTAGGYQGFVYKFDGEKFSRVFEDSDFLSPYPGVFGFGGTSDNWLAIYGAYEGIAWQTKTQNSFSSFHNVSRFFPIRAMGDSVKLQEAKERFVSFRPEAIKNGKNWYVYSLTSGKPKLIKLVEDEKGVISAAWDLTRNLGLDQGVSNALFVFEKPNSLLAMIERTQNAEFELRRFVDLGFDKSKPLEAVSSNINTLPGKVVSARISAIEPLSVIASPAPAGRGNLVQFWLSNDGIFWKEAEPYKTVVFTDPQEKLFWRVKFVPDDDLTTSPVLDRLGLEWQWVKN